MLSAEVAIHYSSLHIIAHAQILLTFDALRCVAIGNADENVAGASCGAGQAFGCLSQTFPTICHPSDVSFSKTSATLAPGRK